MTTDMTAFADKLAELRERATKPVNSVASFCERGEDNQKLAIFLANHSEAIEKVVRAAEVMLEHAPQVVVSGGEGTNYYANDVLMAALNELNKEG